MLKLFLILFSNISSFHENSINCTLSILYGFIHKLSVAESAETRWLSEIEKIGYNLVNNNCLNNMHTLSRNSRNEILQKIFIIGLQLAVDRRRALFLRHSMTFYCSFGSLVGDFMVFQVLFAVKPTRFPKSRNKSFFYVNLCSLAKSGRLVKRPRSAILRLFDTSMNRRGSRRRNETMHEDIKIVGYNKKNKAEKNAIVDRRCPFERWKSHSRLVAASVRAEEGETEKSVWVQRVISNHKCATRSSSCRNKKKLNFWFNCRMNDNNYYIEVQCMPRLIFPTFFMRSRENRAQATRQWWGKQWPEMTDEKASEREVNSKLKL